MPGDVVAVNEVMQAIKALTKVVAAKNTKGSQRFPHLCRNGPDCHWYACGSCWFRHDELHKDISLPTQTESKVSRDIKVLESQIVNVKATIDKRLDDLSCHMERCFACFEAKLDNMSGQTGEISIDECENFNAKVESLDAKVCSLTALVSANQQHIESGKKVANIKDADLERKMKSDITEELGKAFKEGMAKSFESFGELVEARFSAIEIKIGMVGADGDVT